MVDFMLFVLAGHMVLHACAMHCGIFDLNETQFKYSNELALVYIITGIQVLLYYIVPVISKGRNELENIKIMEKLKHLEYNIYEEFSLIHNILHENEGLYPIEEEEEDNVSLDLGDEIAVNAD